MIAYHGKPDLKAQFVRLLAWHREQDKIVQGSYQDDETAGQACTVNGWRFKSFGRGCAVGCSIESLRIITGRDDLDYQNHASYEELIGVPHLLARLEDGIFEGLPVEAAREWPIRFAEAIPVGADLSRVWPQFAIYLLVDPEDGVIKFARTEKQRETVQRVADLYQRQLDGMDIPISEWQAAAAAAYAYAGGADAYAYAGGAAAFAADAYAAAAAAYAADAYAAAAQQARQRQADTLVELLRATPLDHLPHGGDARMAPALLAAMQVVL